MPFPNSDRVIYDKNPLNEVICHVRFPSILRIDAEIPASFQERIRAHYPGYSDTRAELELLPPQIASLNLPFRPLPSYNFTSADGLWTIGLTREALGLTCRRYQRWEEFKEHFKIPLDALLAEYKPSYFSRIGLRYQDIIQRSKLGLEKVDWSQLLRDHITGLLGSTVKDSVTEIVTQAVMQIEPNPAHVRISHGLINIVGTIEKCYAIDSDFYTEGRTETGDVIGILDIFNQEAGRLFRWCITD